MSLRTDIHSAFDAIAPSIGGMTERVVETAVAQARIQNRRKRFMVRMRPPLPLVAALLVVALVVAVIVGAALWRGWTNQFGLSPAGTVPTLAQLEQRPWLNPLLASGGACEGIPFKNPVAAFPDTNINSAWGIYSLGHFVLSQGFTGPLLLRVRDASSGQRGVFIGQGAAGPVVGSDTVNEQTVIQHAEAVFNTSDPAVKADGSGAKTFLMTLGMKHGFSGCFDWQLDGTYKGKPFAMGMTYSGPPG